MKPRFGAYKVKVEKRITFGWFEFCMEFYHPKDGSITKETIKAKTFSDTEYITRYEKRYYRDNQPQK